MKSSEYRANFVRRLPAAVLGAVAVGEAVYTSRVGQPPLAEILIIGGGVLGAALQDGAQYLAKRMSSPDK